jgi:hypothetical protein
MKTMVPPVQARPRNETLPLTGVKVSEDGPQPAAAKSAARQSALAAIEHRRGVRVQALVSFLDMVIRRSGTGWCISLVTALPGGLRRSARRVLLGSPFAAIASSSSAFQAALLP